jgi:hypothetical protein
MTAETVYATADSDDGRIAVNATIASFRSADEASAYLLSAYDPREWDHSTAEVGPGRYGDYWMCAHSTPRAEHGQLIVGLSDCAPFNADQLNVAAPGQHPGGKTWWITPSVDVLVVTRISEAGAAAKLQ